MTETVIRMIGKAALLTLIICPVVSAAATGQ
jgi:hypothetical protein